MNSRKKILLGVAGLLLVFSLIYPLFLSQFIFFQDLENESKSQELPPFLSSFLQEPMTFIGMGSQCIAFAPKEESYVCKMCKKNRYQNLPFFPPFSSLKKTEKKLKRKEADFASYLFAYEHLQEQCGIVYLHLASTSNLNTKLLLIDPLKLTHRLDADKALFYVQKHAKPFVEYITILAKENKTEEIKALLRQILAMTLQNSRLGIFLRDIYPKNIGICENKPLWIDPGRITYNPEFASFSKQKEALQKLCLNLNPFLASLNPELAAFLQLEMQSLTENLSE